MVKKPISITEWQSIEYDPTINGLLDKALDDWGSPEENRANLIRYGLNHLDTALWGINTTAGELNMILGAEKNRKTTLILNIIANIQTQTREEIRPYIDIDTLESGMPPERFRDFTIALMASRHLIKQGHIPHAHGNCPLCRGDCKELRLSPESLRYMTRSLEQKEAIEVAMKGMRSWRMNIYGANYNQGTTRDLDMSINRRWKWLIDEHGIGIFVTDHVQQYRFENDTTDYEKQMRAVQAIGDFVAENNVVVFMLSQVSLWSLREQKQGGMLSASGGRKGQQEANSVLATSYEDNSGVMKISIEESRKSGSMYCYQKLDDESGAFFGNTISPSKWESEVGDLATAKDEDLVQGKAF